MRKKKERKPVYALRMTKSLGDDLRAIAKLQGNRSLASVIREAMATYVKIHKGAA